MFNKTIGDSLSSLICIESCLRFLNMNLDDFYNIYYEYPAVNVKVKVTNKSIFIPNDDETRLESPIVMQENIDEIVLKYYSGRAFIRPSGTEDVLRIYAEAKTIEEANDIAEQVKSYILNNFS
jgi:phosphoacetylglucosamine mutase